MNILILDFGSLLSKQCASILLSNARAARTHDFNVPNPMQTGHTSAATAQCHYVRSVSSCVRRDNARHSDPICQSGCKRVPVVVCFINKDFINTHRGMIAFTARNKIQPNKNPVFTHWTPFLWHAWEKTGTEGKCRAGGGGWQWWVLRTASFACKSYLNFSLA